MTREAAPIPYFTMGADLTVIQHVDRHRQTGITLWAYAAPVPKPEAAAGTSSDLTALRQVGPIPEADR